MATDSSGVMPASPIQSVAEIRTDIGRSAGHAARIAANTSRGKRRRLSRQPPYSSDRVLCNGVRRSEEHTSELQSLMRISYAVFCLKKKKSIQSQYHQVVEKSIQSITIKQLQN